MPVSQHTIAGTVLTMPVRVREADVHTAMFSVDADAAQRLIDYSGLKVCQFRPGRAVVNLMLARYFDGDLGQYNEFGVSVMVNPPASDARGLRALGDAAAFIHQLPVDQSFTLEAGRRIWGYPTIMADFTIRDQSRSAGDAGQGNRFSFDVSVDGSLIVDMEFGRGLPIPKSSRPQALDTYSHLDGVTRGTEAEQRTTGVRGRVGGVRLRLGEHPIAKELASLGLPKRAMATMSVDHVDMTFGDAREIR